MEVAQRCLPPLPVLLLASGLEHVSYGVNIAARLRISAVRNAIAGASVVLAVIASVTLSVTLSIILAVVAVVTLTVAWSVILAVVDAVTWLAAWPVILSIVAPVAWLISASVSRVTVRSLVANQPSVVILDRVSALVEVL